jgi:hypothetical protein
MEEVIFVEKPQPSLPNQIDQVIEQWQVELAKVVGRQILDSAVSNSIS